MKNEILSLCIIILIRIIIITLVHCSLKSTHKWHNILFRKFGKDHKWEISIELKKPENNVLLVIDWEKVITNSAKSIKERPKWLNQMFVFMMSYSIIRNYRYIIKKIENHHYYTLIIIQIMFSVLTTSNRARIFRSGTT